MFEWLTEWAVSALAMFLIGVSSPMMLAVHLGRYLLASPTTVLITMDTNEHSLQLLQWLQQTGLVSPLTKVHLLCVQPAPPNINHEEILRNVTSPWTKFFPLRHQLHVHRIPNLPEAPRGSTGTGDLPPPQMQTRRDAVVQSALGMAREVNADYVVSGSKYGQLGPITAELVRLSPVPVMLVKHHG